mgnify:CR=1 FL=1
MEKLIFVDKTELSFDAIYVSGSELVITVNNGDFAALETKFSDAANLEKLIQELCYLKVHHKAQKCDY